MMTDKTRNTFTKTMVDLVQDIVDYYTVTPLVSQGKAYPGTDQTKQGDKIELIFLKTINYIHPVADNFLHPAVKYVSHGPHSRPLPRGSTVGHVVFTLNEAEQPPPGAQDPGGSLPPDPPDIPYHRGPGRVLDDARGRDGGGPCEHGQGV